MVKVKVEEIAIKILKNYNLCDNCLGRIFGQVLTGLSNEERGRIIRYFIAFLLDTGEKIEVKHSNFYGINFRNIRLKVEKPEECSICKNIFEKKRKLAEKIASKLKGIEFKTFVIGSKIPDKILKAEEKIWEEVGIEFVESIKSEMNREIGKEVSKIMKKEFEPRNPDVTVLVDVEKEKVKVEIRSLFIFGGYKKLVRNIPQSKWICSKCKGKGCKQCKWKGKLYSTSVQEIIEKPLLKATKGKKSFIHATGREDIDARCLDYRPFIIEVENPIKRNVDLKKIEKEINKSKKVKVKGLRITRKEFVKILKTAKLDKTYLAEVYFENNIDKKKLKKLKILEKEPILQKTPLRVLHRRADKYRKRKVKKLSYKLLSKKKLLLKIKAEHGLYIKELITGDKGRTKPSVQEILGNSV
ncbi:MAG: tRNA pseudouridine(54/55) synthase Pus10, partial [Candidatus Aenigmarchaeota archaeon]|nr:tRNA pseudouridine(54/55) synthase Pus10 [Candidatus Aenigmarchaeota archaeon]